MELVVHVTVAGADADLVAGRLWELGTIAVEEREAAPAAAGTDAPAEVLLVAAFPTTNAARWAAAELGDDKTLLHVELVEIADDWRDAWKQHVDAIDVGDRLRVVPAWRPEAVVAGRLSIVLDSGACFGSGTHATTRTILGILEAVVRPGSVVLDVGTGSGILAIAAALLGAAGVDAIDIDPESVPVTTTNAEANGVGQIVRASTTPLSAVAGPYDLVLANVSAGTLTALASDLLRVLAPASGPGCATGATMPAVVLSGMLDGQWRHVRDCFGALEVVQETTVEGWTTVVLRPPQDTGTDTTTG
jgi:ribosomal protein L11 methyltransferase